jgi:hypothetical protein
MVDTSLLLSSPLPSKSCSIPTMAATSVCAAMRFACSSVTPSFNPGQQLSAKASRFSWGMPSTEPRQQASTIWFVGCAMVRRIWGQGDGEGAVGFVAIWALDGEFACWAGVMLVGVALHD